MKRTRKERQSALKQLIRERIEILFSLAEKEIKKHPERARRYISLIKKLGRRYNVRLSRKERMRFCKKCNTPLIPGYNVKIRLRKREKRIYYVCACGNIMKFPYEEKRKD